MPDAAVAGARVVVAIAGNEVDGEAVKLACRLIGKHGGRIYAVHVIEVNRSLPVSAAVEPEVEHGETILDEMERISAQLDTEVETEMVQARSAGPAIVGEAEEWKASAIVMGIPYKKKFGEFNMGRTVPYVLKHATCRVILVREALKE